MAALHVEQNAAYYFPGIDREDPWHFDEVRLARAITFGELVRFSGAQSDDIEKLNRALMKPVTSGRVRIAAGSVVKVPSGRGAKLVANLGSGTKLLAFERDTALAQSGDALPTAEVITVRDNVVERSEGTATNRETVPARRSAGVRAVSVGKSSVAVKEREKRKEPEKVYRVSAHKIRSGDTLSGIAKRYKTSVAKLRELNPSLAKKLKPGMQVILPAKEVK